MGKQRLFFLFLVLIFSFHAFAQNAITPVWSKVRHSSLVKGQTEGWGVDVDKKGNVYWPVSFDSLNTSQQYEIMIYKYDLTGKQIWKSYYGGAGLHDAFVCTAADTNVFVGGIENTVSPYSKSAAHMLYLKLDTANGNIVKHVNINFGDAAGYDEVDGLVPEKDGIYGSGWGQVNGGVGDYVMGFLFMDYNFNIKAKKWIGDTLTSNASHQDGHIVVDSNYVYGSGMWDGHSLFNNTGDGKDILAKLWRDSLGFVDTATFGPSLSAAGDIQDALGSASDGKYIYCTGYAEPVSIFDLQLFVAKFDKNLKMKWIKFFGGSGGEEARAIAVKNGYIYVGGASNTSTYAPNGAYDALLLVYDTVGNFINYNTYGDSKDNEFRDMAFSGHYIYLAGSSGTKMFSVGGTSDSAFLIKVDLNAIVTNVQEAKVENSGLKVFPNPNNGVFTLQSSVVSQQTSVEVYDILGDKVYEQFSIPNSPFSIDLSSLPAGMYFVKVITGKEVQEAKFIKN